MSELLKMARSRDDAEFILRIGAALTVHAHSLEARTDLTPSSRALVDWVLKNPMTAIDRIYAFVSTIPTIAAKITLVNGRVDCTAVTDTEIQNAIASKWDRIAAFVAKLSTG